MTISDDVKRRENEDRNEKTVIDEDGARHGKKRRINCYCIAEFAVDECSTARMDVYETQARKASSVLSSVLGQVSSDKLQRVDAVTADRNVDINNCALRRIDDEKAFLSRWIKRQANVEAGDC